MPASSARRTRSTRGRSAGSLTTSPRRRLYGLDIKKNHPNAKIAILYQNDSYGKDYLYGFKSALGKANADKMVVGEQAYDVLGGATPSSQLARLKATGADTLMIFVTPTPTIQTYAIIRALNWQPANIYVNSVSATDTFMGIAVARSSAATVNGSISAAYLKDPASPVWANDATMKQYKTLMAKYAAELRMRTTGSTSTASPRRTRSSRRCTRPGRTRRGRA